MAETTERGFNIPGYNEKADVPGVIRENVQTAEEIIAAMYNSLQNLASQLSSFDLTLSVMQSTLGTISSELDDVNGVNEEA